MKLSDCRDGDFAELYEVRPGRSLFCRRTILTPPHNPIAGNKQTNLLFVHGSCAASSQYDCILEEIDKIKSQVTVTSLKNMYLYDQMGCGKSACHRSPSDWRAYSSEEMLLDLKAIVLSILEMDRTSELYIIGHSYACSQLIQVIKRLQLHHSSRIHGIVYISGALKDGPGNYAKDGGHWIFKYVPIFVLRRMQSSLSQLFFDAAVHPHNRERLKVCTLDLSNKNDMQICRATYRQQVYADSSEASEIKVSDMHLSPFTFG